MDECSGTTWNADGPCAHANRGDADANRRCVDADGRCVSADGRCEMQTDHLRMQTEAMPTQTGLVASFLRPGRGCGEAQPQRARCGDSTANGREGTRIHVSVPSLARLRRSQE